MTAAGARNGIRHFGRFAPARAIASGHRLDYPDAGAGHRMVVSTASKRAS
jgi:hypothetical protein